VGDHRLKQRRKHKPITWVQQVKIRQGVVHVSTDSAKHAEAQARVLERDLGRDRRGAVRNQTMIEKGVYALGTAAKQALGVEVHQCP